MGTGRLTSLNDGEKWATEVPASPKSHSVTGAGKLQGGGDSQSVNRGRRTGQLRPEKQWEEIM